MLSTVIFCYLLGNQGLTQWKLKKKCLIIEVLGPVFYVTLTKVQKEGRNVFCGKSFNDGPFGWLVALIL